MAVLQIFSFPLLAISLVHLKQSLVQTEMLEDLFFWVIKSLQFHVSTHINNVRQHFIILDFLQPFQREFCLTGFKLEPSLTTLGRRNILLDPAIGAGSQCLVSR